MNINHPSIIDTWVERIQTAITSDEVKRLLAEAYQELTEIQYTELLSQLETNQISEKKQTPGSINFSQISNSKINIGGIVTNQTAGGDIVGRDKLTTNIYQVQPLPPD